MSRYVAVLVVLAAVGFRAGALPTVRGTTYEPGGMLPGVLLTWTDSGGRTREVTSSATGRFAIDGIGGPGLLRATLEGFAVYERPVCVEKEDVEVAVGMNFAASFGCWAGVAPSEIEIQGDVLDERGNPLPDVLVQVFEAGGVVGSVLTESDGKFSLNARVSSVLDVELSKPGFADQSVQLGDMQSPIRIRMFQPCWSGAGSK